jgi:hypothetical protein
MINNLISPRKKNQPFSVQKLFAQRMPTEQLAQGHVPVARRVTQFASFL